MSLKDQLKDQQKLAMLAKDKPRLGAIRLLMAEIKQREVDTRVQLNDFLPNLSLVYKIALPPKDHCCPLPEKPLLVISVPLVSVPSAL